MRYSILFIFVFTFQTACGDVDHPECRGAIDCGEPAVCIAGACNQTPKQARRPNLEVPSSTTDPTKPPSTPTPIVPDAKPSDPDPPDMSPDNDFGPVHPCNERRAVGPNDLVINEVLASVPPDLEGDANGDGTRHAYEDEFVEIINPGPDALELEGVQIFVGDRSKFRFEPLCLMPRDVVVVFGGGSPYLEPDINVISSETRLSLSNSGNVVALRTLEGVPIHAIEYAGGLGSWVLWPQISGSTLRPHAEVSEDPFSPGRCANGSPVTSGCTEDHGSN